MTLEIPIPNDAYEQLKRLQAMCGHETVEETIVRALRLYLADAKVEEHHFNDSDRSEWRLTK